MFGDGVTEASRGGELFGDERLIDLVRRQDPGARALAAAILEVVLDYQHGVPRDDIAVGTTRRCP